MNPTASDTTAQYSPESQDRPGEVLVRVQGASKKFCRDLKKSLWYGVKDVCAELNPGDSTATKRKQGQLVLTDDIPLRPGEFWANKDISFELRRGECLGLIGRNGAGKTTLLKMLNGLIKPDAGQIEMRGRIGALIALGAGFNPILTGRENVYVNGSILGITKQEIDAKIDDIIDFAEIRDFIDSPVQSYSSGMQVRLGFAVATALDPDILILDEVLAVGDAAFRAKCYNRVVSLRKKAAVIFVSHAMEQVARICDSTLVLTKGQLLYHGGVGEGIQRYEGINELGQDQDPSFLSLQSPLVTFTVKNLPASVASGTSLGLGLVLGLSAAFDSFRLRISFYSQSGAIIAEVNERAINFNLALAPGTHRLDLIVPSLPLRPAIYRLGISLIDRHGDLVVWSYKQYGVRITGGDSTANGDCQLRLSAWATAVPAA